MRILKRETQNQTGASIIEYITLTAFFSLTAFVAFPILAIAITDVLNGPLDPPEGCRSGAVDGATTVYTDFVEDPDIDRPPENVGPCDPSMAYE